MSISRALESDLLSLDADGLKLPAKVKSYLRFDIPKMKYVSECNAFILYHLLKNKKRPVKECTIIDHGAGLGIFSFLVKRVGAICLCHDISEEYMEGVRIIGAHLKAEPDHYVVGDTDRLVSYCRQHGVSVHGLGSRNVIEHIPDYAAFFMELGSLSSSGLDALFATSANTHHPLVRKIHYRIHRRYETQGSNTDMDDPTLNPEQCGLRLRSEIIRAAFPELKEPQVGLLAQLNRGFVKNQIIERVSTYLKTGILPEPLPHPSNTCDPYTGAWVERLVSFEEYATAAAEAGFDCRFVAGFYNTHYAAGWKNLVSAFLNQLLKIPGNWRLALSPFLAIHLSKVDSSK